jgi:sugar transferase (PEP-CTERM/EpsH1 system associated)
VVTRRVYYEKGRVTTHFEMLRPKHILQVVHSLAVGGTERVVCGLAQAFNNDEFQTSVCCLDELGEFGRDLKDRGVPVYVLGRKPGLDLSLVSRLRELYLKTTVDIVHAHQYTPYFYAATAAFRAGLVPVIFTEHGRHWPDRLRIKRAIFNQLLRATTCAYTAVSDFTRDCLIRYEKMPSGRIQVIYNGIELNGKADHTTVRHRVRSELGVKDNELIVLTVGRLDRIKDFGTLIQAFAYVRDRIPNASLWIAGDGDSRYRDELLLLTERLELSTKVKFLGSRDDVNSLLRASDLFALCSVTEASSMTILEAMAASRAVVATMTGGNPEIVVHGKTGMLAAVGDIPLVARAIVSLLEDAGLRESMGRAGRARVEKQFLLKSIIQQYRDLYRAAVPSVVEEGSVA